MVMRRKWRGWFRLWVVCTVIFVPTVAELDFQQKVNFWAGLDKITIDQCVKSEFDNPDHPDALKCGHSFGTDKTIFEREGTTPGRYWPMAFGAAFLLDLITTALVALAILAVLWVWRGFRPRIEPAKGA